MKIEGDITWRGINPHNPRHNLWLNHGTWWIDFTTHPAGQKRRYRFSLKTKNLADAQRKRDEILRGGWPFDNDGQSFAA